MNKVWILYGVDYSGREQTLGVYADHAAVEQARERALWDNVNTRKYEAIYWVDEEVQS